MFCRAFEYIWLQEGSSATIEASCHMRNTVFLQIRQAAAQNLHFPAQGICFASGNLPALQDGFESFRNL